jgi:hypothetical protein
MARTSLLVSIFVVSFAGYARADLVPDDVSACSKLSLGSSCQTGPLVVGTCQIGTCTKPDVEHWDRDASPRPTTNVEYECLKCQLGKAGSLTATSTTTRTGTAVDAGADTGIPKTSTGATTSGTGTDTAVTTDTGATTATATSTGTAVEPGASTSTETSIITDTGTNAAAATDPGAGSLTSTATGTQTGTGDKESKDSSGCSVGGARVMAPWFLAGAFAALVTLVRRRRRP